MNADQLSLLPLDRPRPQVSTSTVRLLTFNAQHAAPSRARRQAEWIGAQPHADVAVITEVGVGPGGEALVAALADNGYSSVLAPQPAASDYRTVLASRAAALEPVPSGIGVLPHRGPAATVHIGGHTVGLLGLYVPSRGPKERRNEDKRAFQRAVSEALPSFLRRFDGPVVVAGDLNVVEPGHVPHHTVFGPWEYAFYRSFAEAGLVDAYREVHAGKVEHSWFGRGGNGYRFDHSFVTARHRAHLSGCEYLHAPRHIGLSDHAAMALTLELSSSHADPGR